MTLELKLTVEDIKLLFKDESVYVNSANITVELDKEHGLVVNYKGTYYSFLEMNLLADDSEPLEGEQYHTEEENIVLALIKDYNIENATSYAHNADFAQQVTEIKDKIETIAQHFGVGVLDIEIDLDNQFDEFDIVRSLCQRGSIPIEVVTREVAISNEEDYLREHPEGITENNVGCYSKMIGGKYYFRLL